MDSDCKDIQNRIDDFFDDKLESKETLAFISHVRKCPKCHEEFSIAFFLKEGVKKLDSDDSYNLVNAIENFLDDREEVVKSKILSGNIFMIFSIALAILCGYILSTFFYF